MANENYSPTAYGENYNKMLLDQILRPIKEREQAGEQRIKEMFASGGGYGSGQAFSAMEKMRKGVGEQVEGATAQVGLQSALAKQRESMTRGGWQFQAQEAEKMRGLQKYLQEQGFQHDEIMAKLNAEYQKDMYEYQARLMESMQPNPWESAVSGVISGGTQFGLGKIPFLNR